MTLFYSACFGATALVVLFVMLGVAFGDTRPSTHDIALQNSSDDVVEVAPIWRRYTFDGEESSEMWGGSRPRLLRAFVHERMRVYSIRPRSNLRLEFDNEDWGIDAVLVRKRGDGWRTLENAVQHPDIEFTQLQPLPDLSTLAPADAAFSAFVDEHRGEWRPSFMTWLFLGPAFLALRVLWRAGVVRLNPAQLMPWDWRLEVALMFWVVSAVIVVFVCLFMLAG